MRIDAKEYFPPALATLAFIVAYVGFYYLGQPLFADSDVPWHLAAGDLILEKMALPATDPWSFTTQGQPWYIISWLWDVLLSGVNHTVGEAGTYVFTLALAAFAVGLLATNLRQRGTIGTDAIIFTLFLAGLSLINFITARPQLALYVFVLLYHRLLHESRANPQSRGLYWLPLIMVLWVNMHGSFMAGFTLIGAYGLEALCLKRWAWFRRLFIIGAASAASALINPYGIGMFTAVSRTLDSVVTAYIMEWLPFVFSNDMGISAWFLVFLLASGLRDASIPIADRVISVLWWVAMLFSARNSSIFILVSAPYVAMSLQRWVETLDSIRTRRADLGVTLAKPEMARNMLVAAAAVVVASIALMPALKGEGYRMHADTDPQAAIDYMQEHYAGKRFLTDYTYGGSIAYYTRGAVPVFVDGRAGTAYSEELLGDYMHFLMQKEGWQERLKKYRLDGMMLSNKLPFVNAYDNGQYRSQWRQVYRDEVASIFVRK